MSTDPTGEDRPDPFDYSRHNTSQRDPFRTGRFDSPTATRVQSSVASQVDFGPGVIVAAIAVLVLVGAAALTWSAQGATGLEVLGGVPGLSVLPRLFSIFALVFGVAGSVTSLLTRRWAAVFVTAAGSAVSCVTGIWAVWTQNTGGNTGPGLGLVLALLAMIVLAGRWASYAFSRT